MHWMVYASVAIVGLIAGAVNGLGNWAVFACLEKGAVTFRPTLTQCSDGHSPADCARKMVDAGAAVVGVTCEQGLDRILAITREMRNAVSVPIAAQPSAFRTTDAVPCFTKLPQFPDEMESIQLPRNAFERFAKKHMRKAFNSWEAAVDAMPLTSMLSRADCLLQLKLRSVMLANHSGLSM